MLLVAGVRFVQVSYQGLTINRGDFSASVPGLYAERLNLTLWDSPDLAGSRAYHEHAYRYGPTQFLTLYPMVFLNSYRQIATVLLGVYACVIAASLFVLARCLRRLGPAQPLTYGVLIAGALMFLPLLFAYQQREFEVVIFLGLVCAAYWLVNGHDLSASAMLAYITWFKFWPLVFVGYFVLRRQWGAVLMYVGASAAVLLAAHVIFDIAYFTNGILTTLPLDYASKAVGAGGGFCGEWNGTGTGTFASLRMGFCSVAARFPWLSARVLFVATVAVASLIFLASYWALERRGLEEPTVRAFRILIELSLFLIAGSLTAHAHFYYLILLLLPIGALAWRYLGTDRPGQRFKLALLAAAYLLLSAFVLPLSVMSRLLNRDAWIFYEQHGLYLYGSLLLIGLLLWEYANLAIGRAGSERAVIAPIGSTPWRPA